MIVLDSLEVTLAFERQLAAINARLQQANLGPLRFESMALVVAYTESGIWYLLPK